MYARRVGNLTEPLCEISDGLVVHIEKSRDRNGNIYDLLPILAKWAYAGM